MNTIQKQLEVQETQENMNHSICKENHFSNKLTFCEKNFRTYYLRERNNDRICNFPITVGILIFFCTKKFLFSI